jgi:hypothetical protein
MANHEPAVRDAVAADSPVQIDPSARGEHHLGHQERHPSHEDDAVHQDDGGSIDVSQQHPAEV